MDVSAFGSECASVFLIFHHGDFFFFYHCCFFFVLMRLFIYDPVNTPEPQAASGLHCYPASIAKHHGWFLEAGVWLQLLIHSDAQWDGCSAGSPDMYSHLFSRISLQVLFFIYYIYIFYFVCMNEMFFLSYITVSRSRGKQLYLRCYGNIGTWRSNSLSSLEVLEQWQTFAPLEMKILSEYTLNLWTEKCSRSLSFVHQALFCLFCSCVCNIGPRRAPAVMDRFKWNSYQQILTRTSSTESSGSATWRGYWPTR